MKYYKHSIEVLANIDRSSSLEPMQRLEVLVEYGKVHMSLGNMHQELQEKDEAESNFQEALMKFKDFQDELRSVEDKVNKRLKVQLTRTQYSQLKG